ncbi:MAG TPA: T9SS type A sorting domain-containing protein, partial [Flavobacteriales bacterium]|nr:T9SS type A sorting domain-containing protein [Flavobacteriales bacterium]
CTTWITELPSVAFGIAPNPADHELVISFTGLSASSTLDVLDVQGCVVRRVPVGSGRTVVIDVHDLSAGVYAVRAVRSQGISVQRFVKN